VECLVLADLALELDQVCNAIIHHILTEL
jgi:hypothetical protein